MTSRGTLRTILAALGAVFALGWCGWWMSHRAGAAGHGASAAAITGESRWTPTDSGPATGPSAIVPRPAPDEQEPESRAESESDSKPRRIAALVVDSTGAPRAGVEVDYNEREASIWLATDHAVTGSDGIAWLTPRGIGFGEPGSKQEPDRIVVAAPLADPVMAAIDPTRPPPGPVRLVLPPAGRVAIRLKRSDGSPYLEAALVTVRAAAPNASDDPFFVDWASVVEYEVTMDGGPEPETCAPDVKTTTGIARFPVVGVGTKVVARIRPDDRALRTTDVVLEGPAADGAEATIDVVCDEHATEVRGKFQFPDGRVPYYGSVAGVLGLHSSGSGEAWGRTRAFFFPSPSDGLFSARFELDPTEAAGARIVFDLQLAYHSGRVSGRDPDIVGMESVVQARLPASPRDGVFDLGTIVIPQMPVLAAGVVVDAAGKPVHAAFVSAVPASAVSSVLTNPEGRFEVRGHVARDDGTVTLWIGRLPGFCDTTEVVERGARDVRIVLPAAGEIEGSVLRGEGEDLSLALHAVVEREGGGGLDAETLRPSSFTRSVLWYDGTIRADSLAPGTYAVKVFSRGDPIPLFSAGGLSVEAGKTNEDPRIQKIDLSKRLRSVTVAVTDGRGAPVDLARVSIRANGAPDANYADEATDANGRATFRTSLRPIDVCACARGHRSATVRDVTDDFVEVILPRSAPRRVTITLDPAVVLPEPPMQLEATLHHLTADGAPTPADASTPFIDHGRFGRDQVLTLSVPDPGLYAVELSVVSRPNAFGDVGGGSVVQKTSARVAVGETEDAAIRVHVEPAALAAAVAAATERR